MSTIICKTCGASIPEGAKFCQECGHMAKMSVKKFCTNCGAEILGSLNFCPECGCFFGSLPPQEKRICTNCGTRIPEGMKFCPECGRLLGSPLSPEKRNCRNCGTQIPEGMKFCPECGTPSEDKEETFDPDVRIIRSCPSCTYMTGSDRIFCKSCGTLLNKLPADEAVCTYSNFRMQESTQKSLKGVMALYMDHIRLPGTSIGRTEKIYYSNIVSISISTSVTAQLKFNVSLRGGRNIAIIPPWMYTENQMDDILKMIDFLREPGKEII